jgi:hypothetical protein
MSGDEMDKKRKKIANKIISDMTIDSASKEDLKIQKKTNKELLGHEGEVEL